MRFARNIRRGIRLFLVFTFPQTQYFNINALRPLHRIVYPCGFSLYWASYLNRWDEFRALIAVGSDPNFRPNNNHGSLLSWIILGRAPLSEKFALLELAVDIGADTNRISNNAIKKVLKWDPEKTQCLTEGWGVDTVNQAILRCGLRYRLRELKNKLQQE